MWGKHEIHKIVHIFWNSIYVEKEAQCHKDDSSPQINKSKAIPINPSRNFNHTQRVNFKAYMKDKGPKIARTIF